MKCILLCFLIAVAFVLQLSAQENEPRDFEVKRDLFRKTFDPKDIEYINGRQYFFSYIDGTFSEALWSCLDVNMTLMSLETRNESNSVTDYINNTLHTSVLAYWTSGMRVETVWMWSSAGRIFTYNNWATDEPTAIGLQQACVFLGFGELYDAPCNTSTFFICEERDGIC